MSFTSNASLTKRRRNNNVSNVKAQRQARHQQKVRLQAEKDLQHQQQEMAVKIQSTLRSHNERKTIRVFLAKEVALTLRTQGWAVHINRLLALMQWINTYDNSPNQLLMGLFAAHIQQHDTALQILQRSQARLLLHLMQSILLLLLQTSPHTTTTTTTTPLTHLLQLCATAQPPLCVTLATSNHADNTGIALRVPLLYQSLAAHTTPTSTTAVALLATLSNMIASALTHSAPNSSQQTRVLLHFVVHWFSTSATTYDILSTRAHHSQLFVSLVQQRDALLSNVLPLFSTVSKSSTAHHCLLSNVLHLYHDCNVSVGLF